MRGLEARQHMAGAGAPSTWREQEHTAHGGSRRHGRTWGAGCSMAAHVGGGREDTAHGRSGSMAAHGREELEDRIFNHTHEKESKQEVRQSYELSKPPASDFFQQGCTSL